jgi:glycerol-3-phosphate cytidylyltransferase
MKIGIVFNVFDFFNASQEKMLKEAKQQCDYLICGLQMDFILGRPKNKTTVQSVVERYIELKKCIFVDEIVPYATEQDVEDILRSFRIDVQIMEYKYTNKFFTGRAYCEEKGIKFYFDKGK